MNPLVAALNKFVAYENKRKFQIFEDVTPFDTRPSSPILSASAGLTFSRVQSKLEVDDDEGYFSPCSTSTPEKSSSSSSSSIDAESTAQSTTATLPSERPLKRKGLSVVDSNVSSPARKRLRFEEHCVDYASLDRRVQIDDELETTHFRLAALETMHPNRTVRGLINETKMRRRALASYRRNIQRSVKDATKTNCKSHRIW